MQQFTGFTQAGLNFLENVSLYNSKPWFEKNRGIYDNELVAPFRALVQDLADAMKLIDAQFEVKPAIGKTISRLHRDTRYSRDKSRYRSRLWITFKRPSQDWKEAPAFFFEISPDSYRYGLGYYCAPKKTMDILREQIRQDPADFLAVVKTCRKPFELVGESYKRPLIKEQAENIAQWYNKKSFAVMATSRHMEDIFQPGLTDKLRKGFKQLAPLYHYLMRVEFIKNIPE
ncbi:DUF2461 domain-containing protein [Utexia brackfieldae]